jgi:hypothetical protein
MEPKNIEDINKALSDWCQGDCVLGEQRFVYRYNPHLPLTIENQDTESDDNDLMETEVKGFVVITQTCDLVRDCQQRPFVEVAPLLTVDKERLEQIRKGRIPQYAFIPGVADLGLVADLDRVMTVEKSVVANWRRVSGSENDNTRKQIAQALARKRLRFAFPDDFHDLVKKLQSRLQEKHGKQSLEGEALRSLREIRVRASPDWNGEEVELMFYFIRNQDETSFKGQEWDTLLEKCLTLVPRGDSFVSVDGLVVTLEDMTALEYVESDPLDLDHLSSSYE